MGEPRYRALLIGNAVFRRDPQGLPKLHGPRVDVDALCEALADPETGMFAAEDIEALIDRPLQSLREELHRFFIEDATRDDVLLLYYSGHGKLDLLGRLHLCANDTRASALPVTALRYKDDVDALIEASPAASAVTILDCCHSGAFRGGELKVKATGSGRCVITSAGANQLAPDALGPNGMSPFTSALVAGLRFAQANGPLTAQTLYAYVEAELSPAGNSSPQFYFDGEGAIALARRERRAGESGEPVVEVVGHIIDAPSPPESDLVTELTLMAGGHTVTYDEATGTAIHGTVPFSISLPEARTHLWHLLNEAAISTMPEHDADSERAAGFCALLRDAVRVDHQWSEAVLKRIRPGSTRLMAIEALVTGLAELDADLVSEFAGRVHWYTADRLVFGLTVATVFATRYPESAAKAMKDVLVNTQLMSRGLLEARALIRVLRLYIEAAAAETHGELVSEDEAALHMAALTAAEDQPDIVRALRRQLVDCVGAEEDIAAAEAMQADIAIRLAAFSSEFALEFFTIDDYFLPQTAFQEAEPAAIAIAATSMLPTDPPTAYRLFEVAERRCQSEADRAALFTSLMNLLESPPTGTAPYADHLLEVIDRMVDQVPSTLLRRLSSAAKRLAATAPQITEGLLRLDPDERRSRRALIASARTAIATDPAAARRMATSVERMIGSVDSEAEQLVDTIRLIAVLAPIDFDHALHLMRSLPPDGSWKLTVAMESAESLARFAPDRIDEFIEILGGEPDAEVMIVGAAQGIAGVDPRRAVAIALSLPNPVLKSTILVRAVFALIPDALEDADELARSIESPSSHRARAMAAVARAISESDIDHAAAIAESIPEDSDSRFHKFTALTAAAKSAAVRMPRKAEKYLDAAEHVARAISDEEPEKCLALATVATARARTAPMRASQLLAEAEQLVLGMPEEGADERDRLFAELMIAWAGVAPKRAEQVAERISGDWEMRGLSLKLAVGEMTAIDPQRAMELSRTIADEETRLKVQLELVQTMTKSSPAKAERSALDMVPGKERARALFVVAEALHRRRTGG